MKRATIKQSSATMKQIKWNSADDAPPLTKSLLKKAVLMPPISDPAWTQKMEELARGKELSKKPAISLDDEVIGWFQKHSKNCQASVNHVLRHYILSHELPN